MGRSGLMHAPYSYTTRSKCTIFIFRDNERIQTIDDENSVESSYP